MKNNQIYTGSTGDLDRRMNEHKNSKVKSTRNKLKIPLKILLVERYNLKTDAMRREGFLKTTEGKRLLRKQIRDTLKKEKVN